MSDRFYRLTDVTALVEATYGHRTWRFNQSRAARQFGVGGDGICLSLSCHWLSYQLKENVLASRLGGVGGAALNGEEFRTMAQWQDNIARFPDWQMGYKNFLRNNNFEIRSEARVESGLANVQNEFRRMNDRFGLVILDSREVRDSHAVAVYIGTDEVVFFDPNYGEMWFQNKENFYEFFHLFANFIYHHNHHERGALNRYKVLNLAAKSTF